MYTYSELKRKTALYQAYRADLQAEKDEVQILTKTEEILRSRDTHIQEFQEQIEKERGVAGAQATQDGLEDLSAIKGLLDTSKAQTLDEISKIVNTITNTLKARKSKLAPQIKGNTFIAIQFSYLLFHIDRSHVSLTIVIRACRLELRSIRHRYEEVEAEYTKRKKVYDALQSSIQGYVMVFPTLSCQLI
jgi:hypothetical protein